ncbi:MAG: glycosyltransferase family 4 protein [Lachnospiraceae bacterium]|nr:glycosyltransferase family 4 protein [Lachnospiraceae bacterium]
MKILSLNYEYPPLGGGAGALSEDLNRQLAAAGHRVCVVTMYYPGLPKHEVKDSVEIFRIPCIRRNKSSCSMGEALTYLFALRRFMETRAELRNFDVCHAHFVVPTGLGALGIRRRWGIPYIITAHGSDVEGHNDQPMIRLMHRMIRGLWRKIADRAFCVVSPSTVLEILMSKHYLPKRHCIIPNGIDLSCYSGGQTEKKPVILLIGRMQESKNFQTVLKALSLVGTDSLNGWRVEIVGEGPVKDQLETLAERLGLSGTVTFRGWVDHGSGLHSELLRESAVFVSASRFENCPIAVLEAAASGCSLILSDIPGHTSLIGDQARYFPADDARALAEILSAELEKKRIPKRYDLRRFSWETVEPRYEKLLRACAASSGRYGSKADGRNLRNVVK